MNIEDIREYCLSKSAVSESLPFGPDTLVFKVANKMFLLTNLNGVPLAFNVKCDPEKAIELRATYESVQPGYHMNKKHWNTVTVSDELSRNKLISFIDESYNLVVKSLPKKEREKINN